MRFKVLIISLFLRLGLGGKRPAAAVVPADARYAAQTLQEPSGQELLAEASPFLDDVSD